MEKNLIDDKNYYDYIALSASQLKDYARSPYDFWKHSVFNKECVFKESKSLTFGSMAHCMLLEPEKFESEYVVNFDNDFRTKAGKEWKAAQTRTIISKDEYEQAVRMMTSLHDNKEINSLLYGIQTEKPFIADIGDGFWLKGKMDAIKKLSNGEIIIIDYKTTSDDLEKWKKFNTFNFHDIQVAVYQQLCFLKYKQYASHFFFLVQSTKELYEDKFQVFEYDKPSVDRAIDFIFGFDKNVNFNFDENNNLITPDTAGLLYQCKRDLYNYFKGDKSVFSYYKHPIIMDNSSRDFINYIENYGNE